MYNNTLQQKQTKKMLVWRLVVSLSIIYGVTCFLLSPLHSVFSVSSIYKYTILPEVTNFLIGLLNLLSFGVAFSVIAYSIEKLKISESAPLIVVYICASFLKYTVNMLLHLLLFRSISAEDIFMALVSFVADCFIVMLIATIAHRFTKNDHPTPFVSTAIRACILMAAIRVVSRLIYDITPYGLMPQDLTDFLWMLLYYSLDVVGGIFIYLVMKITRVHLEQATNKI